jgi:hypothetical protein
VALAKTKLLFLVLADHAELASSFQSTYFVQNNQMKTGVLILATDQTLANKTKPDPIKLF